MAKTITTPVHNPSAFQEGDVVAITDKVESAGGWEDSWSPWMDETLGRIGLVMDSGKTSGCKVLTVKAGIADDSFWYPSPALRLIRRAVKRITIEEFKKAYGPGGIMAKTTEKNKMAFWKVAKAAAVPGEAEKSKTRKRVGPGPWDNAPCTHLRWQLMGFFREKLALVKTKMSVTIDGKIAEVEVAKIDVACTKCGTKMTLQAK